jgi:tetratricopeptide (TPR) repeat protein
MKHLSEEELVQYTFDTESAQREEIEAHLAECLQCSSSLAFIESIDAGLRDPDVWEIAELDASSGRQKMREFASRVASENEQAEELLRAYLGNPARLAFADIGSRRTYVTAGVARRLIRAAAESREREALDALTFADVAIDIAGRITGYPSGVIHDLRANGWKERAGALTVLGQYSAALDALDHAEREFKQSPSSPTGHAVVQHARAIVHHHRGELSTAKELVSQSAATYASLGQTDLYMRSRHLLANITFAQGDVRGARTIYEELLAWGEAENDLAWIARESNTVGRCALEAGDYSAAIDHFGRSIKAFEEAGMSAEALRPQWGMALVIHSSGKAADALTRFTNLREEFRRRGMVTDAASISLDMMDALHTLGRDRQIASIAAAVMKTFAEAGMLTSALAAFAYLKEAASHGDVAPHVTRHVREFLTRLEREPALLFRAPPEKI